MSSKNYAQNYEKIKNMIELKLKKVKNKVFSTRRR